MLQTVGNLLAKARGGPSRKAIMAVVSMIRVKILKRSDILFGLPILIPVLLGCNRCADDPENMNFL
jgi:hypothetical protein